MLGNYHTTGIDLPLSVFDDTDKYRYKGNFYGGGISYGYQFILGRHWNLEATLGIGYARVDYKKYECKECGDMVEKSKKNYWFIYSKKEERYETNIYINRISDACLSNGSTNHCGR